MAMYIILALAVVALWLILTYNGLIRTKNRVSEALSDIDVQLKRRYDLIPNLVETVKGYMTHERETLVKLTEARTAAMSTHDNSSATLAEKEKYPDCIVIPVGRKGAEKLSFLGKDMKVFENIEETGLYDMSIKVKDYLIEEVMAERLGQVLAGRENR